MNGELLTILDSMEREKGIDKEILFTALESALVSAARKIVGKNVEDVQVRLDRETGEIHVTSEGRELRSEEFGRIAAQTAKQVIIQKIREAERDIIYDDYHERISSLCTGFVHRFEKNALIIDLGKSEALLPRKEVSAKDNFKQGDRVRVLIQEVRKTAKGPQIIVSRNSPMFVKRLFELEVPEIDEGIVEIKNIAREAGDRTKLAVYSKEEKVDAVGACVGMRGQRVKNIVREIGGERVDIIRWHDDPKEFIREALSPAQIGAIQIDREKRQAQVVVDEDQLSLAIGKHGQNVRLASKLTGWSIDIRGRQEMQTLEQVSLLSIEGVGERARDMLEEEGYDTIIKVAHASAEQLSALPGIGAKTAERMIASARDEKKRLQQQKAEEAEAEAAEAKAAEAEEAEANAAEAEEAEAKAAEAEEAATEEAEHKDADTEETEAKEMEAGQTEDKETDAQKSVAEKNGGSADNAAEKAGVGEQRDSAGTGEGSDDRKDNARPQDAAGQEEGREAGARDENEEESQ